MSTTEQTDRVQVPICGRTFEGTVVTGRYDPTYYNPADELVVDVDGGGKITLDAADVVPV